MNEFNGTTMKRTGGWLSIGAASVVAAWVIAVGLLHAGAGGVSAATVDAAIETGAEVAASGGNGPTGYFPDQFVVYSVYDPAQPHIEAF
jgi:hypothetical protein